MYLISKYSCFLFYLSAGINHIISPDFYIDLIPDYLPHPHIINLLSGLIEITLSLLLLHPKYIKIGAWGIIVLLMFFIPSHIYFIKIGSCVPNGLCESNYRLAKVDHRASNINSLGLECW